jgi:hypothetical protein
MQITKPHFTGRGAYDTTGTPKPKPPPKFEGNSPKKSQKIPTQPGLGAHLNQIG